MLRAYGITACHALLLLLCLATVNSAPQPAHPSDSHPDQASLNATSHAAAPCKISLNTYDISPQKACDFAKQWLLADPGDKISLVCTPEEQCTIKGIRLAGGHNQESGYPGTATMANVLMVDCAGGGGGGGSGPGNGGGGGSLRVGSKSSLIGTNLTFRNSFSGSNGGAVRNDGTFVCTDCVFDNCTASDDGGAVSSNGNHYGQTSMLKLVRPTFVGGKCKMFDGEPCGTACYCTGDDASMCIGCTCQKDGTDGFYCDSK